MRHNIPLSLLLVAAQGMLSRWAVLMSDSLHQFLPVLGELIHSRLEGRLTSHLTEKWAITREVGITDADREGGLGRQPLVLGDLTSIDELGPLETSAEYVPAKL